MSPCRLRLSVCLTIALACPAGLADDAAQPAAAPAAESVAPSSTPPTTQPSTDLEAVRQKLADALAAMGLQSQESRDEVARRLERVAQESAELVGKLNEPQAKLEARNLEMQAYNALAKQAQDHDQPTAASYRVGQMRSAAYGAKAIEAPGAGAVGDFWLLQADLFDLNRAVRDEDVRQRQAVQRLERFVREQDRTVRDEVPPDAKTSQLITEVKLSLLRLYDQRGQSDKVVGIVSDLRQASETDSAVLAHLDEWYGYVGIIGQPFEAKLQTTDGKTWSSTEHLGKVVLLCFGADWFEPSTKAIDATLAESERYRQRGLNVLLVDVSGGAPAGVTAQVGERKSEATRGFPTYRQGPGQVSLQRMFSVRSLPRFVLIDSTGRVRSVAGSGAILEHVESLLAAVPPVTVSP